MIVPDDAKQNNAAKPSADSTAKTSLLDSAKAIGIDPGLDEKVKHAAIAAAEKEHEQNINKAYRDIRTLNYPGRDLISWVMVRAVDKFGGRSDGTFNGACFSAAWNEITGLSGGLDGRAVAAMLHGRNDVETLSGGSHYRLISNLRA